DYCIIYRKVICNIDVSTLNFGRIFNAKRTEQTNAGCSRRVVVMPYKPTWVANAFLSSAKADGVNDIDQLKIQKLVYCLHGWYLAIRGEPVVGELYEAWPYGPVLSSLYHEFKWIGRKPIAVYATDIDPQTGEKRSLMVAKSDKDFYEVFDRVWDRYKGYTGIHLSKLTHARKTPWFNARKRGDDYILNDEIRSHFVAIANKGAGA
ncbi:MAG: DUF4065 domain-containing protein, partial [Aestuariivita sp.]|nr:DUF4065 domain-containing protein [Aestuariivita sp.]